MRETAVHRAFAALPANVGWLVLLAVFTGAAALTGFNPLWGNIPVNIVLSAVVLVACRMVFFERLKLSTLIVMRLLVVLAVLAVIPGELFIKILFGFLVVNILEATLTDLRKGKNRLNFVTGLALAGAVAVFRGRWNGTYYVVETPGFVPWFISYTVWNWLFVTREFGPAIARMHLAVLAAPIVGCVALLHPGLWLLFRGNSLITAGLVQISSKEFVEGYFASDRFARFVARVQGTSVQAGLMVVNVALALVPVYYDYWR